MWWYSGMVWCFCFYRSVFHYYKQLIRLDTIWHHGQMKFCWRLDCISWRPTIKKWKTEKWIELVSTSQCEILAWWIFHKNWFRIYLFHDFSAINYHTYIFITIKYSLEEPRFIRISNRTDDIDRKWITLLLLLFMSWMKSWMSSNNSIDECQKREDACVHIWHSNTARTHTPWYDANENIIDDHATSRIPNACALSNRIVDTKCTFKNPIPLSRWHAFPAITQPQIGCVLVVQIVWKRRLIYRWIARLQKGNNRKLVFDGTFWNRSTILTRFCPQPLTTSANPFSSGKFLVGNLIGRTVGPKRMVWVVWRTEMSLWILLISNLGWLTNLNTVYKVPSPKRRWAPTTTSSSDGIESSVQCAAVRTNR